MFRGNSLVEWTRAREFEVTEESAGNNHKKKSDHSFIFGRCESDRFGKIFMFPNWSGAPFAGNAFLLKKQQ